MTARTTVSHNVAMAKRFKTKPSGRPPEEGRTRDRALVVRLPAEVVEKLTVELGRGNVSGWVRELIYAARPELRG